VPLLEIGRRIYFDKKTGDVLADTGESSGSVRPKTVEDDIEEYKALTERNRATFDFIELAYGQYSQDFMECNGYRINPQTKEIEFSYRDPNQPEQPPMYQKPMSEQIKSLELQQKQTNDDLSSLMDFIITGGM